MNNGSFPYDFEIHELNDDGKRLLDWTRRQKQHYRQYQKRNTTDIAINQERIERLEEMGFSWNIYEDLWMRRYQDLVKYYEHHGHSLVPVDYPPNPKLGVWVRTQRGYKKTKDKGEQHSLSDARLELLERVDFQFDVREAQWMQRFHEFEEHVRINGKGSIPNHKSNKSLYIWVRHQRTYYRQQMKGESTPLSEKRKALLDALGFPWPSAE